MRPSVLWVRFVAICGACAFRLSPSPPTDRCLRGFFRLPLSRLRPAFSTIITSELDLDLRFTNSSEMKINSTLSPSPSRSGVFGTVNDSPSSPEPIDTLSTDFEIDLDAFVTVPPPATPAPVSTTIVSISSA
uniref:Putative secreted peptide n=1 Tax=Anopheles braziliensis TaxID=58242 RepID=A0A2M3ZTM0_9DIPT